MSKQAERQYPLTAVFEAKHTDFDGVEPLVLGTIPSNAVIMGSALEVVEAFDASGLVIDAGTPPMFVLAGVAAAATGRTVGTAPATAVGNQDVAIFRDAATDVTGKAYVIVEYVEPGRHNEVMP